MPFTKTSINAVDFAAENTNGLCNVALPNGLSLTHAGVDTAVLEANGLDLESPLAGDGDLGVSRSLPPRVEDEVPLGPGYRRPEDGLVAVGRDQ